MKLIVILAVLALIGFALMQKWKSIPPQTKQMWGAIFGMASAYRQVKKQAKNGGGTSGMGQTANNTRTLMVACSACGLHVPENEGIHAHGQFYCSVEHVK